MSTFPEQFSEARKSQLDAQFNLIRSFTGRAFDSAEKIIALNFDASRASLEKSSALVRQIMAVKDPRDLFALTREGQSQFDSVMAYGRQLFGIVAAPAVSAAPEAAPALDAPAPAPAAAAEQAPAAPVQASLMPEAEPVAVQGGAAAAPVAEPNAIAKAAGKSAELPKPSAASFPVPSSSKPIEVAPVKPVEAAPPPAPVSGTPEIVTKKAAAPAAKQAKKK
jgi:phasin family protein